MRPGDLAKWLYSFILLFLTVGWAGYTLRLLAQAAADPNIIRIVEVSGAAALLGAMMTWNATVIYFWFRKAPPYPPTAPAPWTPVPVTAPAPPLPPAPPAPPPTPPPAPAPGGPGG